MNTAYCKISETHDTSRRDTTQIDAAELARLLAAEKPTVPGMAAVDPTLHEALAAAGFRAEDGGVWTQYGRRIVRVSDGLVVGEMSARGAWAWLKAGAPVGPA